MHALRANAAVLHVLLLATAVGLPATLAFGHEGHHAECNNTTMNALSADIQAMKESEAKTTATKELEAAQQSFAKNDMDACESHIHTAMEATEQ
jgi:hypothetical protein